jgi:hypothetical protein
VRNCTFDKNFPITDALFKIKTNSKLFIYNSTFRETYSVSRGSIILADYINSYAYIFNTSFINNFAVDGGIFFTHYESVMEFDSCYFEKNLAV